MNEKIRTRIAELNAALQGYARTATEQVDPVAVEALSREYIKAWEGLDACGIAEWMLVYDPKTLTFSLKAQGEMSDDAFATRPMPTVTNRSARNRSYTDDPDTERLRVI